MKNLILLTILISMLISCSSQEDATYTIEEIDSVKHIHNHAASWGEEPRIELEFVQKIGILEGSDDNYMLFRPNDAAVDSKGNIYISESGNYRVQKYSRDGKFIRTIGTKGMGPGEFSGWVRCIDILNDTLYVAHTNNIISKLSLEGKELGRFRGYHAVTYLRHFSTGEFVQRCSEGYRYKQPYVPDEVSLVLVLKPDGERRKIGKPIFLENAIATEDINYVMPEIDNHDNIYITFFSCNRLDKYTIDGTHLFSSDRPLNFTVPDRPEWVITDRKDSLQPRYPVVSGGIAVDSENRIWISTPVRYTPGFTVNGEERNAEYDLHIFNYDGIFLGSIPMPEQWEDFKIRIFGDRLFLIEENRLMTVHEYRIIDK
ncbi:6-bladed beta-propeller [candidate division KSB1 bacterium]